MHSLPDLIMEFLWLMSYGFFLVTVYTQFTFPSLVAGFHSKNSNATSHFRVFIHIEWSVPKTKYDRPKFRDVLKMARLRKEFTRLGLVLAGVWSDQTDMQLLATKKIREVLLFDQNYFRSFSSY